MSIRLEHVSYAYEDNSSKKNYALKDINLEIKKEEFIAVIGHTGSGKSTLIQHLNGLIKPTSGTIYFDDEDIYSEGYPLRELRGKVGRGRCASRCCRPRRARGICTGPPPQGRG